MCQRMDAELSLKGIIFMLVEYLSEGLLKPRWKYFSAKAKILQFTEGL